MSKLDSLKIVAIELFDKAVHDQILSTSRRQTNHRESIDLEEQFRFNDSSYREPNQATYSFNPSMTHREKSIKFSIALSKIPEKKMSNISIMDFKEILSGTYRMSTFRLKSDADHRIGGMKLEPESNLFADDAKQRSDDSGSNSVTKKSSYTAYSDKDKLEKMSTFKESIFTPNQPVPKESSQGYCCQLI